MCISTRLRRTRGGAVALGEVPDHIQRIFKGFDLHSNETVLVRVTPGAGKTYGAARFLEGYAAPTQDGDIAEAGPTAVIAFPTNALLREVSAGLAVPHKVRTGVLGVLNGDESLACQKADLAKQVQNAGGNVHRVLCGRCEFKDACPAREGAARVVGESVVEPTLVLTNHTLLPGVVKELRTRGRTPLVVIDESPPWVETGRVRWSDLESVRERLLADLVPAPPDLLDSLSRHPVYAASHASAWLVVLDLLASLRAAGPGRLDVGAAATVWGRTPANVGRVRSLLARSGLPVSAPDVGLSVSELEAALVGTEGSDPSAVPFDHLPETERVAHARVWGVLNGLRGVVSEGAEVEADRDGLSITGLSGASRVLLEGGGVVLDATGSETLLGGVVRRGGGKFRVEAVDVMDAPGVTRSIVPISLTKKALGLLASDTGAPPVDGMNRLLDAAIGVAERLADRERTGGGGLERCVVFTYKSLTDRVRDLLPGADVHHFGDVRGYNKWFTGGFETYVTLGDPFQDPESLLAMCGYLGVEPERVWVELCKGELTQAHGRARDPQSRAGKRTHLHFGTVLPLGWRLPLGPVLSPGNV